MTTPSSLVHTPLSWIRGAFGRGQACILVNSHLPLGHNVETLKLSSSIPPHQIEKKYWVFTFPLSYLDVSTEETLFVFSVNLPPLPHIRGAAFDTYDEAEDRYAAWAKSDSGKRTIWRGVEGLLHLGEVDD